MIHLVLRSVRDRQERTSGFGTNWIAHCGAGDEAIISIRLFWADQDHLESYLDRNEKLCVCCANVQGRT